MELVGYQTSHKEIWDIYHSVYLLRRSPGLPPCKSQWRREAIHDILSSLRSWLHGQVYPIAAKETQGPVDKHRSRPRRRADLHEEALQEARAAHQRVLEATQVLESDIERLSWGMRDVSSTHSHSHSRSHPSHPRGGRAMETCLEDLGLQRSEAGSSWGKIILHPLPLSASPRTCSSQMNCLIRMCNNSLFS